MTTPVPVPGENELLIPNLGSTLDVTPKVIVELSFPLPAGASVVLLRDGLALTAVPVQISPTAFEFADVVTPGTYNYTAKVRQGVRREESNVYTITVNQELPVPTIVVYATVSIATLFNTSCPTNVDGSYILNVGIDPITSSGEYAIYDVNNLRVDLPASSTDIIVHTVGAATVVAYNSYDFVSAPAVGDQLRLVLIDPDFVPITPMPAETFYTETVSSSPATDAVYPSPLVAVLSMPLTGPNVHWGIGTTTLLVEVTNVGSQAYGVGCGATGVSANQYYQSIEPGQTYIFNVVCSGNPGDLAGIWVNINTIVVGGANFYMETQQVAATQPHVAEIPGSVVAQTIVVNCGGD